MYVNFYTSPQFDCFFSSLWEVYHRLEKTLFSLLHGKTDSSSKECSTRQHKSIFLVGHKNIENWNTFNTGMFFYERRLMPSFRFLAYLSIVIFVFVNSYLIAKLKFKLCYSNIYFSVTL